MSQESETSTLGLLGTLIERWRAKSQRPLAGSWIGPEVLNQCANELEAALATLPQPQSDAEAPPQGLMEKLSESANAWQRAYLDEHDKVTALCAERDTNGLEAFLNGYFQKKRDTLAASNPAQEQELVQRIDRSLELGRILGPEYDGATFEEVARELVALKAQVVPPAPPQAQELQVGIPLVEHVAKLAASPPAQEQDKWQPIETPPETAQTVLLSNGYNVSSGYFSATDKRPRWHDSFLASYGIEANRWMPVPRPHRQE